MELKYLCKNHASKMICPRWVLVNTTDKVICNISGEVEHLRQEVDKCKEEISVFLRCIKMLEDRQAYLDTKGSLPRSFNACIVITDSTLKGPA